MSSHQIKLKLFTVTLGMFLPSVACCFFWDNAALWRIIKLCSIDSETEGSQTQHTHHINKNLQHFNDAPIRYSSTHSGFSLLLSKWRYWIGINCTVTIRFGFALWKSHRKCFFLEQMLKKITNVETLEDRSSAELDSLKHTDWVRRRSTTGTTGQHRVWLKQVLSCWCLQV